MVFADCPPPGRRKGDLCPVGKFNIENTCGCGFVNQFELECIRHENGNHPGTNSSWGVCKCNIFWGFKGPTCEVKGTLTNVMLWMSSLVLFFQVLLLLHALIVSVRAIPSVKALIKWSAKTSTCCCLVTSCAGQVAWGIGMVVSYGRFVPLSMWENSLKMVAPTMTAAFFILGTLNVSVMWIELARRTRRMKRASSNIKRYRFAVNAFGFLSGVTLVTFAILRKTHVAAVFTIICFIAMAASFLIGSKSLESIVKKTGTRARGIIAIQWARKCAVRFSIGAFAYVVVAAMYAYGGQKQNGWTMAINMNFLLIVVGLLVYTILWYIRMTDTKRGRRELARGLSQGKFLTSRSKKSSSFLSMLGLAPRRRQKGSKPGYFRSRDVENLNDSCRTETIETDISVESEIVVKAASIELPRMVASRSTTMI